MGLEKTCNKPCASAFFSQWVFVSTFLIIYLSISLYSLSPALFGSFLLFVPDGLVSTDFSLATYLPSLHNIPFPE